MVLDMDGRETIVLHEPFGQDDGVFIIVSVP